MKRAKLRVAEHQITYSGELMGFARHFQPHEISILRRLWGRVSAFKLVRQLPGQTYNSLVKQVARSRIRAVQAPRFATAAEADRASGVDLMTALGQAVPRGLPDSVRMDVIQSLSIASS